MPDPKLITHYGGWRRTPAHQRPMLTDPSGLTVQDEIDPRNDLPPIMDQGQLGSCTANATAACFQYDGKLDGLDPGPLSRLWIYFQERALENELDQGDTGAIGSDAFKVATNLGICPEQDWPYDINTYQGPVPALAAGDVDHYRLTKPWKAVAPTVDTFKSVLSNKQTIAFGFTVFDSFETSDLAKTGIMPVPDTQTEQQLGGHEVLAVGYLKDQPDYCLVRNSWGQDWGLSGYFLFPWKYLLDPNMCGDWTTIVRAIA